MAGTYTKFIILSEPRSGTHMLRSMLARHPRAICLAEMLNPHWNLEAPFADDTETGEVLEQHVWTATPPGVDAIGFTIHRRNAPMGERHHVWETLSEVPGLHVVLLRRENLLERYLSFRIMKEDQGGPPTPKAMTAQELHDDFEKSEQAYDDFRMRFAGHPTLETTYESLCSDPAALGSVLTFLGLPLLSLSPGTKKNTRRKLSDQVVPFLELASQFRGTPYYQFFEPHLPLANAKGSAELG